MESLEQRVLALEIKLNYAVDELEQLNTKADQLDAKIDAMNMSLTTIIAQRDHAEKSLGRWKNAAIGVMTGLFIGLVGWIAKIALVVQAARITN